MAQSTVDKHPERTGARAWDLALASALMLFVELALIRWTGANILHLSYFSNFVLLGSFLGVGLGFLRARRRGDLSRWSPVLLAALVALVLAFPVQIDQSDPQVLYFTNVRPTGLPAWLTLPLVFAAVAAVMEGLGEGVARLFSCFDALTAYRLDLLGSLLGIAAFTALSFLRAPSVAWGVVAAAGYAALHRRRLPRLSLAALAALVVLLGVESLGPNVSWSPYYKVQTIRTGDSRVDISVNGIPHQSIDAVAAVARSGDLRQIPYQRAPRTDLGRVLVIGAGNGTDVALALGHGAARVDAVEIDPRLLQLGEQLHPDRPYADPRVRTHIDDGRAFLRRSAARYDLVIFALPDSLTLVSGQSGLRLESYLFTVEAIRAARAHLAPGGAFAMYNNYRQTWLVDRLGATLTEVFGHQPCLDSVGTRGRQAVLVAALEPRDQSCAGVWQPAAGAAPAVATDDHPFPYLKERTVPTYYLLVLAAILGASVVSVRMVGGPLRRMRPYADLFFLGSAFLLLETKNVTGFALLFGTTWVVNALVFAGVLLSVLAAVETSRRLGASLPRLPVLYAGLAAALALAWAVPTTALLSLPTVPRLAAAVSLAFAPIFFANLVFSSRLAATAESTSAFGANLLGAVVGGVLEYAALVTGYQALLVLAGGLYLAAFLLTPRAARAARAV